MKSARRDCVIRFEVREWWTHIYLNSPVYCVPGPDPGIVLDPDLCCSDQSFFYVKDFFLNCHTCLLNAQLRILQT